MTQAFRDVDLVAIDDCVGCVSRISSSVVMACPTRRGNQTGDGRVQFVSVSSQLPQRLNPRRRGVARRNAIHNIDWGKTLEPVRERHVAGLLICCDAVLAVKKSNNSRPDLDL